MHNGAVMRGGSWGLETDCLQREEGEVMMRRLPLAILVTGLLAGLLTGCQGKKPDPGEIAGYDAGEQYIPSRIPTKGNATGNP